MQIFQLIDEAIKNIEEDCHDINSVKNILLACRKTLETIHSSNKASLLSLEDKEQHIKSLKENLKIITEKLDISSAHCELLEPIFDKFKEQSIARLEFLNLSKETKDNIVLEINKAEYSDRILKVLFDIELKTKEALSNEREKFHLSGKTNIIKLKLSKSGD